MRSIQVVSAPADVLMLLAGAAVVALAGVALVLALRGRPGPAVRLGAAALAIVVVYGAALVGVALASAPRQLGTGDAKCFDDWCAAMVAARRDAGTGTVVVGVRVENRGRGRTMRSDLARAYLEVPGRGQVAPRDDQGLHVPVAPGQAQDVRLVFPWAGEVEGLRFVLVEGTGDLGPGLFEIGGEGSPFHAVAGWPLPAGGSGG